MIAPLISDIILIYYTTSERGLLDVRWAINARVGERGTIRLGARH